MPSLITSAAALINRSAPSNERSGLVRRLVRIPWNHADRVADHPRPPSAPPLLEVGWSGGLLVAADYPPPTYKHRRVGFG
jgi:hypothetical protein